MSKVIIYQDGADLCVVHPAPGVDIDRVMQTIPEGVEAQVVDADSIPSDRYFREAWSVRDGRVEIDIEGAKDVQRNVWRRMRGPMLTKLDMEVMKSVERGDAKRRRELSDQKQALRDVTETELPDDLDAIRNTIPEILLP